MSMDSKDKFNYNKSIGFNSFKNKQILGDNIPLSQSDIDIQQFKHDV